MPHSTTQGLIDYWQARKPGEAAPLRAAIDPMDFPTLLPQVFILGRRAAGDYGFRLVGGFVGELHDRDLRGVDFISLWSAKDRVPLQTALEAARRHAEPVRVTADVQAGPHVLPLEVVLLPLSNRHGEVDRYLGLYQPTAAVNRLRGLPADRLVVTTFGHMTSLDPELPRIRLAAVGGRRVG